MNLLNCFYTFMTALFTALIVVPFLRRWALDQGNVDVPDARKVHETPTPRLGGIAIFLSFLFSVIVYVPITPVVRGILAGGLIIFITGLIDDLTGLTSKRKFAGEVTACLVTIVIGKFWLSDLGNLFGLGQITLSPWLGVPFTLFAMVGIINAINLIDGLDGLAGGLSAMALFAFFIVSWLEGDVLAALLCAALAGSILGFLKYNFYPARIFMGDAGSLTVGYVLGFLAVYLTQKPTSVISPMVPVLILAVPLVDTLWVMSRRIIRHESPFAADRSHVHHKFLDLGFEHRFTVVIIYSMAIAWICIALLLRKAPEYLLLLLLIFTMVSFYLGLRYILHRKEDLSSLFKDSNLDVRSSVTYQRAAELIDHMVPGLLYFLGGYLLLAIWSLFNHDILSWQLAASILVAGVFLWYRPITESRQFLMLVLYVAVGMASVEVWHAQDEVFAGLSIKRFGDILLASAAVIVLLKIQFRKIGELFLSTADFLTLAVCVFFAVTAQQNAFGMNVNGTLFRAVIAILIVRTLCSHNMSYYRTVAWGLFGFLGLVVVMGLV